ncbi:hypothetical protein HDV00_005588 [Rhizophlyctis rosea]|nr:hypothetical protein HDV00_005588 [Rhizophlyctis rosea]
MTQGNAVGSGVAFVLGLMEDIQLLAFAFRPEAGFGYMPWWMPYLFNPLSYKPATSNGFAILFYIAFAILVITSAFTVVVFISLNGSKIKGGTRNWKARAIWPLHTLRFLTKLLITVLLIPIYEIMVYGFFPVVTLVFFKINPADNGHSSKATGRIDALYTLFRFALVIVLELSLEMGISAVIAAITVVSFIMLCLIVRCQPMFNSTANGIRAGIIAGFAFLCVWLVPGFISGFMASYMARTLICRGVYQRLREREAQADKMEGGMSLGRRASIKNSAIISRELTSKAGARNIILNKVDDVVRKVTVKPIQIFRSPVMATETRIWLDNITPISDGIADMASRGTSDFLTSNAQTLTIHYGLLGATIEISFLVGVFLFRPLLESTTRKQVQILSLVHTLPKKYLNEKVDALEVEGELGYLLRKLCTSSLPELTATLTLVENIMDEVGELPVHDDLDVYNTYAAPEDELADGPQKLRGTPASNTIPSENVMRNYSKRKLTKQLSDRYYAVAGTAALCLEYVAADPYSWRAAEVAGLWFDDFLQAYQASHVNVLQQTGGTPSLFDFPSAAAYEKAGEVLTIAVHDLDPNGCDPSVRAYNESIGFTYVVTSDLETIFSGWYENAKGFFDDPPEAQNLSSPRITYIVGLVEDIAQATSVLNSLLVADVDGKSKAAEVLNIFIFVLALVTLMISYALVFRNVVAILRKEMMNISNLYFSLPVGVIQSVPELKRFIESGGAVMPAMMHQRK